MYISITTPTQCAILILSLYVYMHSEYLSSLRVKIFIYLYTLKLHNTCYAYAQLVVKDSKELNQILHIFVWSHPLQKQ